MMKVYLDLDETEEALVAAAAAANGMTVKEWITYEVRAGAHLYFRLGAKPPAEGGLGREPVRAAR